MCLPSPSSRRAWIEIKTCTNVCSPECKVALLAEGVDRNAFPVVSPAAGNVALLTEGVDRNSLSAPEASGWPRRPPRGGRG